MYLPFGKRVKKRAIDSTSSWGKSRTLEVPVIVQNAEGMGTAGACKGTVPVGIETGLFDDAGREAVAIEPSDQVIGSLFDGIPIALRVGGKQLFPGNLGVHRYSFRCVGDEVMEMVRAGAGDRFSDLIGVG
jgi:hypothetical protein